MMNGLCLALRSSASSRWSVSKLGSQLVAVWRADAITGATDGAVIGANLAGADGTSITLSQPTTGNQLVYAASVAGLNNKPALLTLSGAVQRYMTVTTGLPSGTAAHTLLIAVRTVTAPAALTGFASLGHNTAGSKGTSTIGHDASAMWWGGDDQVAPTGGAIAAGTSYILSKTFSGGASGTVIGYRNGVQVATASSYTFGLTGGFVLGSYTGSIGGGCDAYIAEIVVCNTALSAADRQAEERRLGTKYAITVA